MKLSEVKGERVFDVMADVVGPVFDIASSKSFKEIMNLGELPADRRREVAIERIRECLPAVIRENRDSIVDVLSIIGGVERSQYVEGMTLISLWSDVMELVSDGDFMDFLSNLKVLTDETSST